MGAAKKNFICDRFYLAVSKNAAYQTSEAFYKLLQA